MGEVEYFSTFFNFSHITSKQAFTTQLSIKVENKIRIDSADMTNKLKELYGRNLLETLWPYITSKKIKLESVKNKTKVNLDDNLYELLKEYRADEYSVLSEYITLVPNLFSEIELIQDFFYNEKENTLSNRIKEVYLCAKRKIGNQNSSDRILKLVF